MTKYILQVSAHGKDVGAAPYTVPENWKIGFFVKMGEVLDYGKSEDIYKEFRARDWTALDKQVVHWYFGSGEIADYALWDLNDARYVSGVVRSTSIGIETVENIAGTTETNPDRLSAVLTRAIQKLKIADDDEVIVYFNACRA